MYVYVCVYMCIYIHMHTRTTRTQTHTHACKNSRTLHVPFPYPWLWFFLWQEIIVLQVTCRKLPDVDICREKSTDYWAYPFLNCFTRMITMFETYVTWTYRWAISTEYWGHPFPLLFSSFFVGGRWWNFKSNGTWTYSGTISADYWPHPYAVSWCCHHCWCYRELFPVYICVYI